MDLFWYRVELVRVVDGDTAEVLVDLGFRISWRMHIRLLGINAPEVVGATKDAGLAAKAHLEKLLTGPGLMLKSHKDQADKYGNRWLGEFFRDGVNLNQQMIADGHAVAYTP